MSNADTTTGKQSIGDRVGAAVSKAKEDFSNWQNSNLEKAKEQGASGWADYHSGRSMNEKGELVYGLNTGGDDGPAAALVSAPAPAAPVLTRSPGNVSASDILKMAEDAGLVKSQADMEAIVADPNGFLSTRGMTITDLIPSMDPNATGTNLNPYDTRYDLGTDPTLTTATVDDVNAVSGVTNPGAQTYTASTVTGKLDDSTKVNAETGTIDDDNLVDTSDIEIDVAAEAEGTGVLGNSLNDFATQNISTIIDTSTPAGKLLAEKLGEGGYTDHKATILGQMDIISAEFKDSNGNPKIPPWAQAMVRETEKTIAFSGITGTAATAAYANAVMEATLGVADKEAAFFQTITTKNLDNRQEGIINKAKILANFELGNLNARETAAVTNAKAFLEMDLKNLTNEQQAEVVNKQAVVQALFEDQKVMNSQRLFTAESRNEMAKFYDELNSAIARHNSTEMNTLAKFNAGETNTVGQFNAEMSDSRDRFYSEMQYNIDVANAKWRQTVETTDTAMMFEAVGQDVKNALDISTEAQNRLWDSVDNLLDYIFKGADNEANRDAEILAAQIRAQAGSGSSSDGKWGAFGQITAAIIASDMRLKENIEHLETMDGIRYYTWDWNAEAKRVGLNTGPTFGVMAQEVQKTHPEAVVHGPQGYLLVNYGALPK
jgi:hypothetical protein